MLEIRLPRENLLPDNQLPEGLHWVSPAQAQCLAQSGNARKEVKVGSHGTTVTLLKNNSGDDTEDTSELGDLWKPELVQWQ